MISENPAATPAHNADNRRHVVVIGSGFGGLFSAKTLKRAGVDVTLIARTTHHLFQPLLYQVATGILSGGEVAPTTRGILRRQQNVKVLLGDVTNINLARSSITSSAADLSTVPPFDSLIVAAGAQQSYFGNDRFAEHAPGMKTIDDALEVRGRILRVFEHAELTSDPAERARLLTFVVVGAGPTGVELAGQIAELAQRTLPGSFRHIAPQDARIVLLDAAPAVLPPFDLKLRDKAATTLRRLGVEIQLDTMVTDVDEDGLVVRDKDSAGRRIESRCKVWSAGVAASPLGQQLATQSGATLDRAGRVRVNPDLTLPGYSDVFVIGDLMSLDRLPGVAQVAIQGGRYVGKLIKTEAAARRAGHVRPERLPFNYHDKGSMATVARFSAVAQFGRIRLGGGPAWLIWLAVHLAYLVGYKSRISAALSWLLTFSGSSRPHLTITRQQVIARTALDHLHTLEGSDTPPTHSTSHPANRPG
jgi:NADH dehydrogenase